MLVTNSICGSDPAGSCTESLTVLFQDHVVNINRDDAERKVTVHVDGVPVDAFPQYSPWIRIEKLAGEQVTVLLPSIQVSRRDANLICLYLMRFIKADLIRNQSNAGKYNRLNRISGIDAK